MRQRLWHYPNPVNPLYSFPIHVALYADVTVLGNRPVRPPWSRVKDGADVDDGESLGKRDRLSWTRDPERDVGCSSFMYDLTGAGSDLMIARESRCICLLPPRAHRHGLTVA